jgi:hypothetical protein
MPILSGGIPLYIFIDPEKIQKNDILLKILKIGKCPKKMIILSENLAIGALMYLKKKKSIYFKNIKKN